MQTLAQFSRCRALSPRRTATADFDSYSQPVNKADRDRARIAELRKLARIAQGRDVDQQEVARQEGPQSRWEPDVGIPRFVKVGPGTPVLLMEEAARRLNWATAKVEAAVAAGELESVRVAWTTMVPLSEVERMARTITGES